MLSLRTLGTIAGATALAAVAAPAVATANPVPPAPVLPTGIVTHVVDGDTVDVMDFTRGQVRVRILGIDAPEIRIGQGENDCWGPQASTFAYNRLLNQPVAIITDPTQAQHDMYGRLLAYVVKIDGWNYSVEAARAGFARSYVFNDTPVALHDQIVGAESQGKAALNGLWVRCDGAPEAALVEEVYYEDCTDVWNTIEDSLYEGDPGYEAPRLDGDSDGIACEDDPR